MFFVRRFLMLIIAIFWISVFLTFFSYFGYPLTLMLISIVSHKTLVKFPITPSVSLIITAFNEEIRIRNKLENTLKLIYPKESLQIIVASDGSTDKTHDIVTEYKDKGVQLLVTQKREGKESAQAHAVEMAHGNILVFSDTATQLDPDALCEIVSNFSDPSIGCVSSEDKMIGDGSSGGENFYVTYEMWLRKLESRINSVVGLSGSFFAARREVCNDFSPKMQSDFRTLLSSMKKGLRGIIDPKAIGYYQDIKDKSREFQRKVRTVLRGLTVFFNHIEFLNFFKFGFFSYQFFCHKLMRWLMPIFLFSAFISCAILSFCSTLYLFLFTLQILFYGMAIIGIFLPALTNFSPIKASSFFLVSNVSIFIAWLKYLKGDRITLWQPSIR